MQDDALVSIYSHSNLKNRPTDHRLHVDSRLLSYWLAKNPSNHWCFVRNHVYQLPQPRSKISVFALLRKWSRWVFWKYSPSVLELKIFWVLPRSINSAIHGSSIWNTANAHVFLLFLIFIYLEIFPSFFDFPPDFGIHSLSQLARIRFDSHWNIQTYSR